MFGLRNDPDGAEVQARLRYFVWRWYRLRGDPADDIVQAAVLTYCEVRERYGGSEDRPDILLGILRNKCREHIARKMRRARGRRRLEVAVRAGETNLPVMPEEPTQGTVLDELIQREDGRSIIEALARVRPKARRMFHLLGAGATRKDLLRHYRVNKNTLDSRLHAYRGELRELLAERGVLI